jgi:hypothetical protein
MTHPPSGPVNVRSLMDRVIEPVPPLRRLTPIPTPFGDSPDELNVYSAVIVMLSPGSIGDAPRLSVDSAVACACIEPKHTSAATAATEMMERELTDLTIDAG